MTSLAQRSQVTGVDAMADHHCVPAVCDIVHCMYLLCMIFAMTCWLHGYHNLKLMVCSSLSCPADSE